MGGYYINLIAESAVFAIMLGLSIAVGLYFGCAKREQNVISEYLLGGKRMSVFPIAVSLIASHISGISLFGVPTEVYSYGTQYLIAVLMNVVAIVVVLHIYLPVFYELQLTSIYEYLEQRFDSNIRGLCSLIYVVSILLFLPQVIYVSALVISQISGYNIHFITPVICAICIFYTTVGGLRAVVWTDTIQSVFTAGSIVAVLVLGLVQVGGFGNMIKANREGDRIEFFRMDPDPFLRHTFWTVNTGTAFTLIIYLGVHPGAIQRFAALPTYIKARKALIYFGLGLIAVKVLTGTVGMLIFATYKDCDPVSAKRVASDKNLLPYFVMDVAADYPGLTGLFVSGLVSAALSTMSAQLNTVCATVYKDFLVKILGFRISERRASIIMKCIVVVVGVVCVLLVKVVENMKGIIQLTTSVSGITNGAILSVFTLGICSSRANSRGAMCGMLASLGVMAWIVSGAQLAMHNNELIFVKKNVSVAGCPANTTFKNPTDYSGLFRMNDDVYVSPRVWKIFTVSYMHYNTIGIAVGMTVGLAVSWLFPSDQNVDPKLLAPFIRKRHPRRATKTVEFYIAKSEDSSPVSPRRLGHFSWVQ